MDNNIVTLRNISKSFGQVRANRDISLSFGKGRIKALLGENGAGKSTLMAMLAGRLQPDSGEICIHGQKTHFRSPKDAHSAGIGMVYQHFMLVESMTVAENVILGQESGLILSPQKIAEEIKELAATYSIQIDPLAKVGSLSMGEKQRVEILKLLRRKSELLIFDEPTAVLTPTETVHLFATLKQMAKLGKSIVFISHKLQEVLEIADEVSILRLGEVVDEFDIAHMPDKDTLAKRMIGRSIDLEFERTPMPISEDVITVKDLEADNLGPVSFTLCKGEVLAIAGVAGNGQKELVEILAGLASPTSGQANFLGRPWDDFYPQTPQVNGLAYIPEDRQGIATCPQLSLVDNLLLTARETFTDGLFISRPAALAATLQHITNYSIRPGNPWATARSLSGGNLQKLVIARELMRQPSIIIAENPTQGLDVAATEEVWQRLLSAREHAGILLVTGDISEALQLADRIAVMFRGKFLDCFPKTDTAKVEAIGMMMAGVYNQNPSS